VYGVEEKQLRSKLFDAFYNEKIVISSDQQNHCKQIETRTNVHPTSMKNKLWLLFYIYETLNLFILVAVLGEIGVPLLFGLS
jgi:hypothetical protein